MTPVNHPAELLHPHIQSEVHPSSTAKLDRVGRVETFAERLYDRAVPDDEDDCAVDNHVVSRATNVRDDRITAFKPLHELRVVLLG